jgi:hypothetical protein
MNGVDVKCENCGATTFVRFYHATRVDPGYPDRDTCEECDAPLDFENSEPAEPPEPDPDRFRE